MHNQIFSDCLVSENDMEADGNGGSSTGGDEELALFINLSLGAAATASRGGNI
jgi:hypothetical protein